MNNNEIVVLIAEDDEGHCELIVEQLKSAGVKNKILKFKNGAEVLNFFFENAEFDGEKYISNNQYLLLLDLDMPEVNGVEVLKKLKDDKELKKIPVIILTTTDDSREIKNCYELGCSCYITKPVDFNLFAETLRRIGLFILIVKIPEIMEN